ncbi:hypothetical protein A2276_06435 [candidate division WOR-1 bacterium RIFOXYA12_FULL_43_27]|uniref:Periplasmic copper-binding protein NosD beta helix domain-containing protein n=1 Tax=candidate division WOR-1 bacterium RIFOXYC2_FULL_46_14 TaxID=1802587 RepID=A0A1F4U5A3_UNCSA|nr:MAG: hypothetical protein A2276_06435 [candidate division WOR-1 bacterium RIFOXYA12_FULL_43_27]OGC20288.1 MAG: hypothetical protein A2292_04435 [candidate division WOR-1 bacterium RIFOXYB2_FULL_46_45]OGC31975.1 MAG: hypothetical protein A2232_07015 [candidate division WOR-1 bacterium RIFOXYA2_FULL_46_56]OGC40134.1 MAG: hypothetical protein A2438_02455 [candidate division WOR-1 bacterium RIFOXYC2_FULL_46_14]
MRKVQSSKFKVQSLIIWVCFALCTLHFALPADAATYTVTNTDNAGAGSLRQAITDANGNPGADTVAFNIPAADAGYVTAGGASYWRIRPTAALPNLEDASGGTTIDGTTQTTNQGDTNPYGPEIMLDGTNAGSANGLTVTAKDCIIERMIINNYFLDGIVINPTGAAGISNTKVYGCYIGTDATGEVVAANAEKGINVFNSFSNIIGSSESGRRNLISGNTLYGIDIVGSSSSQNRILGNYIGTNRLGTAALANGLAGINLIQSASNEVGGVLSGEGNIISGNTDAGINIDESDDNLILGNYIGVAANGTSALANGDEGVFIFGASQNNNIGNGTSGGRNIISGNTRSGISIGTSLSTIKGNYIGTDINGSTALGNGLSGIAFSNGSSSNTVGGVSIGDRNIISGNSSSGIILDNASNNVILGNYIGLDSTGAVALGNAVDGIYLGGGASYNDIGNGTAAGKNIISGNNDNGIEVLGTGTDSNEVSFNYIGTNADGDLVAGLENANNEIYADKDVKYLYLNFSRIQGLNGLVSLSNGANGSKIENNVIVGTRLADVKGIFLGGDGTAVSPTVVSTNEIRGVDFGIDVDTIPSQTVTIDHCTIVDMNKGIQIRDAAANIKNCIISSDPTGSNIASGTVGVSNETGTVTVSYSDIYGNALSYYNFNGTITKTATIHANPLFSDSVNNDYNLAFNSPCINTGTPAGADMGAYQYSGATPEVRVITPVSGDNWQEESTHYITWHASADVTSVDLHYSTDNGATYTAIVSGISNTGSYSWTLPKADSTQSKVKAVVHSPSQIATAESAAFTISSKSPKILGQVNPYPTIYKPLTSPTLKLGYQLSTDADVTIYLINKYGKLHWKTSIASGNNGGKAGYNEVEYNGISEIGGGLVPNGIYFIKVIAQNRVIATGHLVVQD